MTFLLGVATSLIATLLFAVGVAVWKRLNFPALRLALSLTPRMARSGITNVFASREEYVRNRKPSTATEYMKTAKRELVYVGFWLAQTGEIENLKTALRSLLDRDVRVTLVLLDRNLDVSQRSKMAAVLGLSREELGDRLENAWKGLLDFRRDLPIEQKQRLVLKGHQEHIQASAFLFDRDGESAKTLVDVKFYAAERQASFGLELRPPKKQSTESLYRRATESFGKISDRSTVVEA